MRGGKLRVNRGIMRENEGKVRVNGGKIRINRDEIRERIFTWSIVSRTGINPVFSVPG